MGSISMIGRPASRPPPPSNLVPGAPLLLLVSLWGGGLASPTRPLTLP
jgi:hypothetical protein